MDQFWVGEWTGKPFALFGASHLAALGVVAAVIAAVWTWQNPTEAAKKRFRYGLAAVLLVDEALIHLWWITAGKWDIQHMLPFHLCALLVYLSSFMLITKNYRVYEFCYFFGIAGATQALLTPDNAPYDFPHWRYFSVFISHGSMVIAAIYMTRVEGLRPTWGSALRAWFILHVYAIPVFILNALIGSDYLFINRPPDTPSLIDMMGPWPYYLIGVEALAILFIVLLYLPFAVRDWRRAPASA